jgi:hypothetical protein
MWYKCLFGSCVRFKELPIPPSFYLERLFKKQKKLKQNQNIDWIVKISSNTTLLGKRLLVMTETRQWTSTLPLTPRPANHSVFIPALQQYEYFRTEDTKMY